MDPYLHICKAKSVETGNWIVGYYLHSINGRDYIITKADDVSEIRIQIDVRTLCRCTGVPDSGGTIIFENDLLDHDINIVEYHHGAFWISSTTELRTAASTMRIIGNFYDDDIEQSHRIVDDKLKDVYRRAQGYGNFS